MATDDPADALVVAPDATLASVISDLRAASELRVHAASGVDEAIAALEDEHATDGRDSEERREQPHQRPTKPVCGGARCRSCPNESEDRSTILREG